MTRDADDTGLTHGWATFIHALSISGSDGAEIAADYDGNGCWRFAATGPVTAKYTMLLQHDRFRNEPGDDELAYRNEIAQFWTGRALFVEGAEPESIRVEFNVPDHWRVTAPWPTTDERGRVFAPQSMTRLLQNGLMLGHQSIETIKLGDATVVLGLAGEGPAERQTEISTILRGALDDFGQLFRSPPVGQFAFFMGQGRLLGGGVVGQTVSMLVTDRISDDVLPMMAYVITHETFHLWNAEIQYAPVEDLYWFSEGSAEYYTFLALTRRGVYSISDTMSELGARAAMYETALDELSMVAAGIHKLDHYDLIYSGGLFAVAALDMRIADETRNKHRLYRVLPALYETYRKGGNDLTLERFAALIDEQTGVDTGDIIQKYIKGTEILPHAEIIRALEQAIKDGIQYWENQSNDDADF